MPRYVVEEDQPRYIVETGPRYPGSLATPQEAQAILRATAKGTVIGLPAAIGAGLGTTALPVTGPTGPLIGAGVGAGTGQAGWQAIEPYLPQSVFGPSEEPKTLPQAFQDVGQAALSGPAYEMGGQLGGALLNRVLAPFARRITPQGQEMLRLGEQAGFRPAVEDVRRAPLIGGLRGIAQKGLGGGVIGREAQTEIDAVARYAERKAIEHVGPAVSMEEAGQGAQAAIGRVQAGIEAGRVTQAENILTTIRAMPGNTAQRGEVAQSGLTTLRDAMKDIGDYFYEELNAAKVGIPSFKINDIANRAAKVIQGEGELGQLYARGQTSAQLARPTGQVGPEGAYVTTSMRPAPVQSRLQALANLKGQLVPFTQLRELEKEWGALAATDPTARFIVGGIKNDIEAGVAASGNAPMVQAWKRANNFWREGPAQFKEGPLADILASREPVRAMNYLLANKDASLNALKAVKTHAGEQNPVWQAIRGEAAERALDTKRGWEGLGPGTRNLMFSQGDQRLITAFHEAQPYAQDLIRGYLKRGPEAIVPAMIRSGEASAKTVSDLKMLMGNTPEWSGLQSAAMYSLLKDPKQIARTSDRVLGKIFDDPGQIDLLRQISTHAQTSQAPARAARAEFVQTGRTTMVWDQLRSGIVLTLGGAAAAAGGGVYAGYPVAGIATGATILLTPKMIAYMTTRPGISRFMAEGFRVPVGSAESIRITSQLVPRYIEALGEERRP